MGYIRGVRSKKHPDFNLDKFKINVKKKEAICPKGHKNESWKYYKSKKGFDVSFNKEICQKCSCKNECISTTRKKRTIEVVYNYDYIKKRRKEQKKEKFKKEMSVRAQIEGTISELVRFHGLRKAKYKGEKGRELQFLLSAAGLNTKRLLKAIINKNPIPATC